MAWNFSKETEPLLRYSTKSKAKAINVTSHTRRETSTFEKLQIWKIWISSCMECMNYDHPVKDAVRWTSLMHELWSFLAIYQNEFVTSSIFFEKINLTEIHWFLKIHKHATNCVTKAQELKIYISSDEFWHFMRVLFSQFERNRTVLESFWIGSIAQPKSTSFVHSVTMAWCSCSAATASTCAYFVQKI